MRFKPISLREVPARVKDLARNEGIPYHGWYRIACRDEFGAIVGEFAMRRPTRGRSRKEAWFYADL